MAVEIKEKGVSRRTFVKGAGAVAVAGGIAGSMAACTKPEEGQQKDLQKVSFMDEGEWIPTKCNMCFNRCSIVAHVVDGVVVEIKGDERSTVGSGTICGKGASGIMQLYDPNRVTKPLRRTNPNKGLDQDPGWEEIGWDEAYAIMDEKFRYGASFGPTGLASSSLVGNNSGNQLQLILFPTIYGGSQSFSADICGAGIHPTADIYNAFGNSQPDYQYVKYLLQFGTQAGTTTRHGFNISTKQFAKSRKEGAKLVSFDPHMSGGADKSDLWVPIRPGTDAAAALAIQNVLVHELDLIDRPYLTKRTNGPALIDDMTGRTLRDPESNKALYWDLSDNTAKTYDDRSLKEPALEGAFTVDGKSVKTAFTLLKANLEKYTPEYQEPITTVPAATIRQIAKDFGEAATIGATIELDGFTMPHRPACADLFSGVSRHKHSMLNNWAIYHLNVLVGSLNSVGGLIGFSGSNHGWTPESSVSWEPGIWEEDGFIVSNNLYYIKPNNIYEKIRNLEPKMTDLGMSTWGVYNIDPHFAYVSQNHPEIYGNQLQPSKVMFVYAANPIKWWGNHDEMADMYRGFEYVVGCDIYLNDSSYFYDLFIPEASYLERWDCLPNLYLGHHTPGAVGLDWSFGVCQPVIPAKDNTPSLLQIFIELADRAGVTERMLGAFNRMWNVKEEYALTGSEKVDQEELLDSLYKSLLDKEHGIEWLKENGTFRKPRAVDEVYIWADDRSGRVPIYMEFMLEAKEKVDAAAIQYGIEWDTSDYQALPEWKPCNHHHIEEEGFDTYPIYWTDAINTDTWQTENAYISEINSKERRASQVEMNAATAKAKGLADGDKIRITSPQGFAVEGQLFVTEGIHPECIAVIVGSWGATSSYVPLGRNVGVPVNHLNAGTDPKYLDHASGAFDQCVRCKIEKI